MDSKRIATVSATIIFALALAAQGFAQGYNISPPSTPVNLLWIHHSTGGYWAYMHDPDDHHTWSDGKPGVVHGEYGTRHDTMAYGGNGEMALFNNNYILHHLTYGSQLGETASFTDTRDWYRKFRNYLDKNDTTHYVDDVSSEDLVHCYSQDTSYQEQGTDEFTGANIAAQTNRVIMFKSCFPNSNITAPNTTTGCPANPTAAQARTWVASQAYTDWVNSGETGGPINYIKAEYMALLDVFGESRYRNILFVAWVAPPETTSTGVYARQLADWFETQWLASYPYKNVLLFNYWNIHTGDHQPNGDCWPAVREKHNHCRYFPFIGRRDYTTTGDPDFVGDIRMAFPGNGPGDADSHPGHFGGAVAAKELIHLLNIQWNRMNNIAATGSTGYPTNGRMAFFLLDSTYAGTLPSGVTKATIDGVSCLNFNGTSNARLDLGNVANVVGAGGAFSYCLWYRPTVGSVNYPTRNYSTVMSKAEIFNVHHYAEDDVDSHINTDFGGDYLVGRDHRNNVVDCDTWTHVAFTWDGLRGRHFVDGVQIIETTTGTRSLANNSNHLILGSNNAADGYLKGGIREVAIYNRALTADEVRRIFQANAIRANVKRWTKY